MMSHVHAVDGRLPTIVPKSRWSQAIEIATDLLIVAVMIYVPPLVLAALGILAARLLDSM